MRHRVLVLVLAAAAAAPIPASAAVILSKPPTYVTSGAGPFQWRFASTASGQYLGGTAYRFSTDTLWRRCRSGLDENQLQISDLPEGAYTLYVTDDYNRNALGGISTMAGRRRA